MFATYTLESIYHRHPMQTNKFQPEGKQKMQEMRVTEIQALSVDPGAGISRFASETDDRLYICISYLFWKIS